MAIGIIGMFLLMGISTLSATGLKENITMDKDEPEEKTTCSSDNPVLDDIWVFNERYLPILDEWMVNVVLVGRDPDGMKIKYTLDGGPHSSGTTSSPWVTTSYTLRVFYDSKGTYTLRGWCTDEDQQQSNIKSVTVTLSSGRAFQEPFLKPLEQHPILYQLLQRLIQI